MDLSFSDVDIPDEITELDLNQLHELSQGLLVEAQALADLGGGAPGARPPICLAS